MFTALCCALAVVGIQRITEKSADTFETNADEKINAEVDDGQIPAYLRDSALVEQRKQRESSVSLKFAHSLHQLRRDSLCMATLAPTMAEMIEVHREDRRRERRK